MWQRGMNWAATSLVGVFGLLWLGVVVFAAVDASMWSRLGQGGFSTFLMGWACYKAGLLLRRTEPRFVPRHRRIRA
ncbi:hypothetical protein GCM10010156_24510 [Planobispora rosea]|uniref:Uncharacterized protein n=1 Tax=Planobispora rosea TaxID=35762 RepID=A0A8J3WDG6_PLARO|nr:hypothetical protein [Planobispora rosea]GGS64698.1 hypothetical protein GCM10010156_24510 [Planobispora rosea]GIH84812.1 hypothetical protein Pro02_32200 [Planobispora rosea]